VGKRPRSAARQRQGGRLEERVTIDAVDTPLEVVLGNLLGGGPYALYFGVAESGERLLE
jgi:hypothetical protein